MHDNRRIYDNMRIMYISLVATFSFDATRLYLGAHAQSDQNFRFLPEVILETVEHTLKENKYTLRESNTVKNCVCPLGKGFTF